MTATRAASAPGAADEPLPPIGGFFEAHPRAEGGAGVSVLAAWTAGRPYAAFVNARSAFAALTAQLPEAAVWLPAFLCPDMVQPAYASRIRFYPVDEGFAPDLAEVVATARPGDLVLVAAYFGQPVAAGAWLALASRPDLRIVEDRAQALDPGESDRADWTLFSPRKLLGVADGGLLVAASEAAALPRPTARADEERLWRAARLRAADPLGRRNAEWHAANQAKEAAMTASAVAMTEASLSVLASTSLAGLAEARMENWRRLDVDLRPWSALPADIAAPPLGYVLRLAPGVRERVLRGLHAQRIFAAVHWPQIAAPAGAFPREDGWSRALITLPCDHRYGEAQMARIAACVRALLP